MEEAAGSSEKANQNAVQDAPVKMEVDDTTETVSAVEAPATASSDEPPASESNESRPNKRKRSDMDATTSEEQGEGVTSEPVVESSEKTDVENAPVSNGETSAVDVVEGNDGQKNPQEKQRMECLDNMEKIEKEFSDLKEKFFRDQAEQLKHEIQSLKDGSHVSFQDSLEAMDEVKADKIWAADQWRKYQLQNIENVYKAEVKTAEDEYNAEKKQIRDRVIRELEVMLKKVEDAKSNLNLTDAAETRRSLRRRPGSARDRDEPLHKASRRKLTRIPPHINYTLSESEIMEDLAMMEKQDPTVVDRAALASLLQPTQPLLLANPPALASGPQPVQCAA